MTAGKTIPFPSDFDVSSLHLPSLSSPYQATPKSRQREDNLAFSPPFESPNQHVKHKTSAAQAVEKTTSFVKRLYVESTPIQCGDSPSDDGSTPTSMATADTLTEGISPALLEVRNSTPDIADSKVKILHRHRQALQNSVARPGDRFLRKSETIDAQQVSKISSATSPQALVDPESAEDLNTQTTTLDARVNNRMDDVKHWPEKYDVESFTRHVGMEELAKQRLQTLFSRLKASAPFNPSPSLHPKGLDKSLSALRNTLLGYGVPNASNLSSSASNEQLINLIFETAEALRISAQAMAHERLKRQRGEEKYRAAQEQVAELSQEIKELSAEAVSMIQGIDEWRANDRGRWSAGIFSHISSGKPSSQRQYPEVTSTSSMRGTRLNSQQIYSPAIDMITDQQALVEKLQEDLDVAQVQIGRLQHQLDSAVAADGRDALIHRLQKQVKELEHRLAANPSMKSFSNSSNYRFVAIDNLDTLLEQTSIDYQALVAPLLEQIAYLRTTLDAKNNSIDDKLARMHLSRVPLAEISANSSNLTFKHTNTDIHQNSVDVRSARWVFHQAIIAGLLSEIRFLRAKQLRDAGFRNDLAFQKNVLSALVRLNRNHTLHRLIIARPKLDHLDQYQTPKAQMRKCMAAVMFATRLKILAQKWQHYKKVRQSLRLVYSDARAEHLALQH